MVDYKQAKLIYSGRKCKHLGRSLGSYSYLKLDEARNCFVVGALKSRYAEVNGRWERQPREKWVIEPIAEIYEDRIVVLSLWRSGLMYRLFGLRSYAANSKAETGREWRWSDKRRTLELPVVLKDGELSSPTPTKKRTFAKDKQKKLNALIRKVRNDIIVRAKLGAFDNVSGGKGFYTGEDLLTALSAVTVEDITTFHPIVQLINNRAKYQRKEINIRDIKEPFNRLINRMKERLLRAAGAVEYV